LLAGNFARTVTDFGRKHSDLDPNYTESDGVGGKFTQYLSAVLSGTNENKHAHTQFFHQRNKKL
jgi:hypothetical protein